MKDGAPSRHFIKRWARLVSGIQLQDRVRPERSSIKVISNELVDPLILNANEAFDVMAVVRDDFVSAREDIHEVALLEEFWVTRKCTARTGYLEVNSRDYAKLQGQSFTDQLRKLCTPGFIKPIEDFLDRAWRPQNPALLVQFMHHHLAIQVIQVH